MGKYTVIADVGKSIIDLLKDKLVPEPVSKPDTIGICDPKERGSFVVGIHPYNFKENSDPMETCRIRLHRIKFFI